MTQQLKRPIVGAVGAAVIGALALAALSSTPPAVAADDEETSNRLVGPAANQILVLSANVAESIYSKDRDEKRDLNNFAARVRLVLNAVEGVRPDVVLLQEVNDETAQYVATKLGDQLGVPYAVAVVPPDGQAVAVKPVHQGGENIGGIVEDSTVLYNTTTMDSMKVAGRQGFGISESYVNDPEIDWFNTRTPIVRLKRISDNRSYLFSSIRFLKNSRIKLGFRESRIEAWADALKDEMLAIEARPEYAGSTLVIGGDFNHYPCFDDERDALPFAASYGDTNCQTSTQVAKYWRKLVFEAPKFTWTRSAGIDHIFTTGTVLSHRNDSYDKNLRELRIPDAAHFKQCDADYQDGEGAQSRYPECRTYYYSDHAFSWARIGPPAS